MPSRSLRVVVVGALLACALSAGVVRAQGGFIEEVEKPPPSKLDDVDLDAPEGKKAPPKKVAPKKKDAEPQEDDLGPAMVPAPATASPPPPPIPVPQPPPKPAAPVVEGEPAAPPPKAPEAKPVQARPVDVQVVPLTYGLLRERWDERTEVMRKHDGKKERAARLLFDQTLEDLEVHGLPGGVQAIDFGNALIAESRKALDEGDGELAHTLAESARRAAPDVPTMYTNTAAVQWSASGDIAGALASLRAAWDTVDRDPVSVTALRVRLMLFGYGVVIALLMCFGLMLFLRTAPLLSFDVVTRLPRGAAPWQVLLLVAVVGLMPFVAGAGPLLSSLWLLTLVWLYLTRLERLIAIVLGLVVLTVPMAVEYGARLWSFSSTAAALAHRAFVDVGADDAREALRARTPGSLRPLEKAVLAAAAKREGRIDEAVDRWRAVVKELPDASFAHNNFGIVSALQGNNELAIAEFKLAAEKDPLAAEPLFNWSLVVRRYGKKGDKPPDLTKVDGERTDELRKVTFHAPNQLSSQNRAYVSTLPDPNVFLEWGLEPSNTSSAVEAEVASGLLLGQAGMAGTFLIGILLAAWGVQSALERRVAVACACVSCGLPRSLRADGPKVNKDVCSQCFHIYISTTSRIDAEVRLRKERHTKMREGRRERLVLALSVLWAGLGHLYAGAVLRGIAFATSYAIFVGALIFAKGFLPGPHPPGIPDDTLFVVIGALGLGLTFVFAARSAANLPSPWRRN
jgi:tetratricopeptide (TPR) repeat protein